LGGKDNAVDQVSQFRSFHDLELLQIPWMEAGVSRDQNVTPLDGNRLPTIPIHSDLDRTLAFFQNIPSVTHTEQESRLWYEDSALLLVPFVEHLVILTFDEGLDSGPDRFQ
jgi:hypothetical protein